MDTTQMMMASGGMLSILIGLLMLLLPFILLLIAWRILKWSSTTAQQVTRLTEQMDELIRQLQHGAPATAANIDDSLDMAPDEEKEAEDDFEILTAAPATAADSETETETQSHTTDDETAPAGSTFAAADDSDVPSFEFPADEDEEFGDLAGPQEKMEPAAAFGAAEFAAEPADESEGFSFDNDEEMPDGDAADLPPAVAAVGQDDDFLTGAGEDQDPLDSAFDSDEEDADSAAGTDAEERRMEESFDSAFPPTSESEEQAPAETAEEQTPPETDEEQAPSEPAAEETPQAVEEPPAIIRLDDDPARPEVSLARCGSCDHKLAYKKTLSGKRARCPSCKGAFVLP